MAKTDGDFAFPLHGIDGVLWEGMTLRDYFAGQALAGIAASIGVERKGHIHDGIQAGGFEAKIAYTLADAMLTYRENNP